MDSNRWWVEVVDRADGSVVRKLGPHRQATAPKIEDGIAINLDHDRFRTRLVKHRIVNRALRKLYQAVTHRQRFDEFVSIEDGNTRRHQAIDFTVAQLQTIGLALREAREALESS